MEFVDGDGNIIVPKSVRPIIDLNETAFGSKKGAKKQYRYGNLHIREYEEHYSLHMDRVDPMQNPLGHLLVDAPEYVVGAAAAFLVGRKVGVTVYNKRKQEGRSGKDAAIDAVIAGYVAGSSAGRLAFDAANSIKKR
ncbi:MAG TPA: hypothetical protein VHK86_00630, partial [Nitrososphaera sp.]|nr:hypothetical protein [Nitrososphaera sp.]